MIHGFLSRHPLLSGYVAVFPIVTFLSLAVLALERSAITDVASFLRGALLGVVCTGVALGLMIIIIRAGAPAAVSVLFGLLLWFALALGFERAF